MRYDDTLETVLAADVSTSFGKASAWRQLVDLIGRRRVPADARAFHLLNRIRDDVPLTVRAASARALEVGNPPAPLVALCAIDDIAVAAPVLRSARLSSGEWVELLPRLSAAGRSVLRARRDLPPGIDRALETFGPIDFVIAEEAQQAVAEALPFELVEPEPLAVEEAAEPLAEIAQVEAGDEPEAAPELAESEPEQAAAEVEEPEIAEVETPRARFRLRPVLDPVPEPTDDAALLPDPEPVPGQIPAETSTFVAVGAAALGIPLVARALGRTESGEGDDLPHSGTDAAYDPQSDVAAESGEAHLSNMSGEVFILADRDDAAADAAARAGDSAEAETPPPVEGPFEISEVVARIDAFYTRQQDRIAAAPPPPRADGFRFETDEQGAIRWVEGVSRAPLIGLSLELNAAGEGSRADGVAAGALRQRAPFTDARLTIVGESDAAGEWRISAAPAFDRATGRFSGYRGTARRPRREENASTGPVANPAADSLRQLMHELRTPTNAIAGFAEMIEREMLGDAPPTYRERAATIRMHARALLAAIDDLDIAARIEASALHLVPGEIALRPVLSRIADDLGALAELRGAWIALPIDDLAVRGDARAIERLLARMLATLLSAADEGERVGVAVSEADGEVAIAFDRPRSLAAYEGEAVFGIDDEQEDAALLGTGFALRLVRNIARELSGQLIVTADAFIVQLPATVTKSLEQAR